MLNWASLIRKISLCYESVESHQGLTVPVSALASPTPAAFQIPILLFPIEYLINTL